MRVRRSRCKGKEVIQPSGTAEQEVLRHSIEEDDEDEMVKGFFACYLLCSLSPRHKGHTYIGFTVNPQRRIKQHNGEKRCGAWRTKRGRPWDMVLCIYGFPSNVSALQFEWAWQHPTESLAVRKVASSFKSLSGMANKIKIAYAMLNLSCWESLNLTVNFFSTKYMKHIAGCPKLPNQMRVNICSMDDLPCYSEGLPLHCSNVDEEEEDGEVYVDRLNINIPSSVDVAVEETNRNLKQMKSSSQFSEPVYYNSEFSKPSEDQCDMISYSSRMLPELNEFECTRDFASLTSSSCSKDSVMEMLEMSVNWLSPRSYDNETMAVSPNIDMINLCTPSTGIIRSKTKRALFESDIIDLTDSPTVIHL